jgi:hypothetical protein
MSRVVRHLLASTAMVLLVPLLAAAQVKDLYRSYMISGEAKEVAGDVKQAEQYYARAVQYAPSTVDRIEAQLRWASLLSRHVGEGDQGKQWEQKAAGLYQAAIAGAGGEQRLRARNDYGVFLFRCGRTMDAAKVLGQIAQEPWPEPQGAARRARLLYNYGQVLESDGRGAEAVPLYLESMRLDVRFSPPREAAQRLAEEPAAASLPASADPGLPLLAELLDQKRGSEAEALLLRLAEHPERLSAGADRFADLFLRYLTETRIEPARFSRVFEPPSQRLQQALPPAAAECIAEIRKVYGEDLRVDWNPHAATGLFPCWSQADRVRPFSSFLKTTGDAFVEAGEPSQALERYSAAASLLPGDAEAALDLGNLLVEYGPSLDPQGEILARFTRECAADPKNPAEPGDLEQLVFLHSLLAADAQEHKRLGPENDPRSAVYQWQLALEADAKLAAAAPEQARPRPLMLEQLAAAYEGLGDIPNAEQSYRAAAQAYLSLKQPDRSASLLARADGLDSVGVFIMQADGSWQTAKADPSAGVSTGHFSSDGRFLARTASQGQAAASASSREPVTQVAEWHRDRDVLATTTTGSYGSISDSDWEDKLPATASLWPAVGLTGLLSLAGALTIRHWVATRARM